MAIRRSHPRAVVVRHEPRISVCKLGEYMVATPPRRRQILRDQKRPPDVKVARYSDAYRAIVDYFVNGHSDPDVLARHQSRLVNWSPGPGDSAYGVQKNQCCRDAIESFSKSVAQLGLTNLSMSPGGPDGTKMSRMGVTVSVRPEIMIRGADRKGVRFVGALKLYISKGSALDSKAGDYVAALVHEFVETRLAGHVASPPQHCFALDVFAGRLFVSPKNFMRRRSDIAAACQEIAAVWNSV